MKARYRAAIIGFGKIGAAYADDAVMARHYPYATHAQALASHPRYEWAAVVDPRPEPRRQALERWGVTFACASVEELFDKVQDIDVAIIATPPDSRCEVLSAMSNLRAVVVEKPLGDNHAQASAFFAACTAKKIAVEVNYWRRFDADFRHLAEGELERVVGKPQAVFGVYGNGLRNNGSHMIDLCSMLFGDIQKAEPLGKIVRTRTLPISGDVEVPFRLEFEGGLSAILQPVDFAHYRENGLDIWGTTGRLQIMQEGLRHMHARVAENRAMAGEFEVPSDRLDIRTSTVGNAFFELYNHLALVMDGSAEPLSPLSRALAVDAFVEQICLRAESNS